MPILAAETSIYPANLLDDFSQVPSARRWWAVHTLSRQEKSLVRQLLGYEIPFYLPLVPKDNVIRGRRVRSQIPLFGGYVFVYGDDTERVKSLTTKRVSRILPVSNQAQLRHDLSQIQRLIATNAPLTVERRLRPGRAVRIKKGAMAGLEGIVLSRRADTRLLVAVHFLQQGVSVEIDDFLLEPID
ncbi:MAG: hypothetical protein A2W31_12115 [Planctomycetes bacterium RBG_16_64_10]|nr:MAG: hypothetical protein A2W31_12115 [Planctomycetes bacterium RBG_16_64_10]